MRIVCQVFSLRIVREMLNCPCRCSKDCSHLCDRLRIAYGCAYNPLCMTAQEMAAKRWAKPGEKEKAIERMRQVNEKLGIGPGSRGSKKPRLNKRIVKPILSFLLWYFLAQGASLTIVGPFGTQTACENYRAEISEGKDMLADVPLLLSWPCWSSTPETGPYRLK